jgi:DNA-binding LacI/PurR family transcriptional regulator
MGQHLQVRSRRATLNDVGALSRVSYQTVSRVVNNSPLVAEKTRERVLKAIAELGYLPNRAARRLATRRSRVIGMIGSHITYYGPAQVMLSVEETAKQHGYNLMFAGVQSGSKPQVAAAIDDLFEHQVDGLVLGVRVEGGLEAIRKLCRGVPFVALDPSNVSDVPTVIVDQQYGTRLAIQHLLNLGHQQIACIGGPPSWSASKERRRGWAKALKHAGLEPGPYLEGDWSAASGFAATEKMMVEAPGQFTAIVAANDHMALGALRALHAHGIEVPGQMSVVGYDDLPESRFFEPPLTTVHHDFARQGERCMEVLLGIINRQTFEPSREILKPKFVIRESTAAARG